MLRRGRLAAVAVAVVSLLAVPSGAQRRREFRSGGVSQLGGQVLPPHRNALAAGGLYPSMGWFQFTKGMSRSFDMGFRGDLFYASPLSSDEFGWSLGFTIPMRIGLSGSNKVAFAIKIAPDFVIGELEDDSFGDGYCHCHDVRGAYDCHCHDDYRDFDDFDDDDFGLGPGFEVGLLVGIPVSIVNIVCGITSPMHFIFFEDHEGIDLFFPIAPFAGAEIRLRDDFNVFGVFQGGITIHSNEFDSDQEGYFRFWAGIEYAM